MAEEGAAQGTATVITALQLKTFGLAGCPVAGCVKKPEGFKSKQALKFHLQSHPPHELSGLTEEQLNCGGVRTSALPSGPYHCGEPNCTFGPGKKVLKNLKTATQHLKKHNKDESATFSCTRCPRKFTLKYRLTEHLKTCGEKKFLCRCGLALTHKSSLKTHITHWETVTPGVHGEVAPPPDGADGEDGGAGAAGEGEAGEGEEALGVPLQSEEMHAATALHPGTI